MKKSIVKHKNKEHFKSAKFVISNYVRYLDNESENLDLMSEYSLHLFNLIESPDFVEKVLKQKPPNQFFNHARSEKFTTFPCLILEKDGKYYFYTQRDIIMFFRGINYHGQKSIDKKKRILNEYVQNSPSVNMIFLVGVSFIETPVFQFSPKDKIGSSLNENKNSTGLLDYGFPFTVQKIGGKIFTKIEACWYKILMDFFNAEPIKLTYLGYDWFEGSNYNFSDKELENLRKMNKYHQQKMKTNYTQQFAKHH